MTRLLTGLDADGDPLTYRVITWHAK